MIEVRDLNPHKKYDQSAHEYYKNKKVVWDLRKLVDKYNKNRFPQNPWVPIIQWNSSSNYSEDTVMNTYPNRFINP
jgi:hypothetical protein